MSQAPQEFKYSVYRAQMKGQKMAKLHEQVEQFSKKIEQEKNKLQNLDQQIDVMEEELLQKRLDLSEKTKNRDEDPIALAKKNKGLQTKLDGIRHKQNNIEADNIKLKESINTLRKEKNLFNSIFTKLQDELTDKKDDLIRVISKSNFARQYIERGQAEFNEQQKQAFIEQKKYEKEFSNINHQQQQLLQDTEVKIKINREQSILRSNTYRDFITQIPSKSSQNISILHERQSILHERQSIEDFGANTPNVPFKQIVAERKERIKLEDKQFKILQSKVQENEKIFEALQIQTGCENMEDIIKIFVDYEEENYILFRNVNQLDDEYETLQRQKKTLQEELKSLSQQPKDNKQDIRAVKMTKALQEISEVKQKKKRIQNQCNDQLLIWDLIKVQIPLMHSKLQIIYGNFGYDHEEGLQEDINMNNATKYLSQMEILTQNILSHHSQVQSQKSIEKRSPKFIEDSKDSSTYIVVPANEEFDKAMDKLGEEFRMNIDKAMEEKRPLGKEQENKDKFITVNEMREQAEKDFKKYPKKTTLAPVRRGTIQQK